jgi:hypothetical protein
MGMGDGWCDLLGRQNWWEKINIELFSALEKNLKYLSE